MTTGTVKKCLTALADKGLVNEDGTPALECEAGKFFTLPNEIFLLDLPSSAFVVYAYLLLIEDRRMHTCHPSYNTIAAATGLSKNTALKSVGVLLEMALITVEATSYFDQRGMKWKGNNLYTILPIRIAVEEFHQRQLCQLELDTERRRIHERQAKLNHRRPTVALCASTPVQATPDLTHPRLHKPLCIRCRRIYEGRKGKQEKAPALLLRRAGHNRPQCGRFRRTEADAFSEGGVLD